MSSHSQHHQSPPEWHSTSLLSKSVLELRAALSSARQDSLPVVDNGGVPVPDSKEEDVESQLLSRMCIFHAYFRLCEDHLIQCITKKVLLMGD